MRIRATLFVIICLSSIISVSAQSNLGWRRVIDKATFDISVNPRNPNTYYTGGEGRLVYRSYDGGNKWDTLVVNYRQGYSRLNNVLIHPVDTNIIIVGGLNFGIIERCTGDCDKPDNWKVVLSSNNPVALNGKSMVFKPDQPDTVYAGDFMYGIVWRSTNKGETWDSISTVMHTYKYERSDGTFVDTLLPIKVGAVQIREDSSNVIVFGSTSSEVFVSQDGGYTWTYQTTLIKPALDQTDCEITRLVFSDKNPKVGYACITYIFLDNKNNGGLYKTTDGGYNWKQVAFPDTSLWALDCRGFGETEEVFIGGYTEDFYMVDSMRVPGAGIVRRSQDGGQTWWSYDPQMDWALRFPKSNSELHAVNFPVPDTGYAVGKYGVIMRSENKGMDWSTIYNPGYQFFRDAAFSDSKRGLIVASSGEIMKTVNGGVVLTESYKDAATSLLSICMVDQNNYRVTGGKGLYLFTTDEGSSWEDRSTGINEDLNSVYFSDNLNGWACGSNGTIIATTDGGNNWITQITATGRNLHSVTFTSNKDGIAVGDSGVVLKTTDAGNSWILVNRFTPYNLYSVSFNKFGANKLLGLVTGDMGTAFVTSDGGNNWIAKKTNNTRPFYSSEVLTDFVYVASGQYSTIIQTQSAGEWWFVNQRGDGPISNMWSLRYLGEKDKEKLYMATEAGLFVLDFPSTVREINNAGENQNLKIFQTGGVLRVEYSSMQETTGNRLYFRIADLNGRILYEDYFKPDGRIYSKDIFGLNLHRGAYICQMVEKEKSSIQIIIID